MAFGLGGSSKKSSSSSESQSTSSSSGLDYAQSGGEQFARTYLDPRQQAAQQQLQNQYFGGNERFFNRAFMPFNNAGRGMLNRGEAGVLRGGQEAFDQSQQYGQYGQAGANMLGQYANPNNPYVQQQIGQLGQNIGQNLQRNILPGINQGFAGAQQRGSSRHGIAQGLALQGAQQQFQEGATGLYSNAYNQGQQAANQLAQYGQQGQYGQGALAQQNYGTLGQLGAANAQIGQNQYMAQFQPFQIGQQIVGAPSLLSNSYGYDNSQAFGLDQSQSQSTSKSKNKSKGSGANIYGGGGGLFA